MDLVDVIIRPLHTEKSYVLRSEEIKKYAFEVNKKANKHEIALAFEMIYGIVPEKINVINRKPTAIRTGTRNPGMSKHKKIAYITLAKGVDIIIDQEQAETKEKAAPVKTEKEVKVEKKEETKAKASKGVLTKVVKTSPKSK